jgi:hypothetical protein
LKLSPQKKRKKTLDLGITMSGWYVSVERLNALENGKVTDGKIDYISYYIMLSTVHASDTQNSI